MYFFFSILFHFFFHFFFSFENPPQENKKRKTRKKELRKTKKKYRKEKIHVQILTNISEQFLWHAWATIQVRVSYWGSFQIPLVSYVFVRLETSQDR